jgi:hypothetical protein
VGVVCAVATLAKSHIVMGSVWRIRDEDMSSLSSARPQSHADLFGRERGIANLPRGE